MTKPSNSTPSRPSPRQPTDVDARIGQLIRERRQSLNLSQGELAIRLGIAQSQLQKYEQGENRISASRLVDCATALEVSIAWFYQWAPNTTNHDVAGPQNAKEQSLLDVYRDLTPDGRSQLADIAQILKVKTKNS